MSKTLRLQKLRVRVHWVDGFAIMMRWFHSCYDSLPVRLGQTQRRWLLTSIAPRVPHMGCIARLLVMRHRILGPGSPRHLISSEYEPKGPPGLAEGLRSTGNSG